MTTPAARPSPETRPKRGNEPGVLNAAFKAKCWEDLQRPSPYFSLPFSERVKQALAA